MSNFHDEFLYQCLKSAFQTIQQEASDAYHHDDSVKSLDEYFVKKYGDCLQVTLSVGNTSKQPDAAAQVSYTLELRRTPYQTIEVDGTSLLKFGMTGMDIVKKKKGPNEKDS